jgi:hypothetical protein
MISRGNAAFQPVSRTTRPVASLPISQTGCPLDKSGKDARVTRTSLTLEFCPGRTLSFKSFDVQTFRPSIVAVWYHFRID